MKTQTYLDGSVFTKKTPEGVRPLPEDFLKVLITGTQENYFGGKIVYEKTLFVTRSDKQCGVV